MKNPEQTRTKILEASSVLFNRKGYAGSSISDIMKATGIKKGGVYNHFGSKQELKIQAFRHSLKQVGTFLSEQILHHEDPLERLYAIPDTFVDYTLNPVIDGGCPLLNTAIEADDTNPELRTEVQKALRWLQRFFSRLFREAKEAGVIDAAINEDKEAIYFISALEGGVMLSRLNQTKKHIEIVTQQLRTHINQMI